MQEILVDWTTFKAFVNERSLSMQYVETDALYIMKAGDSFFVLACNLDKELQLTETEDFEDNYKPGGNKKLQTTTSPFAAKILPNGDKLYMRKHGISASVSGAPDNIDFVIPYDSCKLTGIEIISGEAGDKVNLKVLDTPTGTISGVPNYMLNQFGFDVNVAPGFYESTSLYDADLIKDMKIRIEYDGSNSDLNPKTAYINITLHEVKP